MTDEKFLTEKDLAKRWKISHSSLQNQRWSKAGPPYFKIGRFVRYRLSDIEDYENKHMRFHNSKIPNNFSEYSKRGGQNA